MTRSLILPVLTCMLAAAPLTAQDDAAPADLAGRNAISLDVGGGYVVGVWRQATPRMRVGFEAGITTTRTEGDEAEDEYTDVVVQPSVKLFSAAEGSIRPYTLLAAATFTSGVVLTLFF